MDEMSVDIMENGKRFSFSISFSYTIWIEIYNKEDHLLFRRLRGITDDNHINWDRPIPDPKEEMITPSVRDKIDRALQLKAFW